MSEIAGAGRRRLGRGPRAVSIEPVAAGVHLVRGGFPKRVMNVYLLEDEGGVTLFDAGIRDMAEGLRAAAEPLGGIRRIVLGHAHEDHRGAAAALGAPVLCHTAEREYAVSENRPTDYFDLAKIEKAPMRAIMARMLHLWDGGPVPVDGTLEEGDEVAGFRVVHVPGHAPGMIALFREADRLALTTDCFYTLDPISYTSRYGPPRTPHPAFNRDTDEARESMRKVAALEPAAAWPGHADPLVGDVRAQLERAAAGG